VRIKLAANKRGYRSDIIVKWFSTSLIRVHPRKSAANLFPKVGWHRWSRLTIRFVYYFKAEQQRLRSSFLKPTHMLINEIELEGIRTRD